MSHNQYIKRDIRIIAVVILIVILMVAMSCTRPVAQVYYYNAYSPLYDEYFVIKSDRELKAKDIVWFNDDTEVVSYRTPYVATIISPYKSN
jgi:hypothetical protein